MKKTVTTMLLFSLLGTFLASAQDDPRARLKSRLLNRPQAAKPKMDFAVEPSVAPSDDLDVNEFLLKRNSLKGKVIELTFDKVLSVKQAGDGYIASVTYESGRMADGVNLVFPAEGLKLFKRLAEPGVRRRESVYVEVLSQNIAKVLGTRYSKGKPEGERYTW